LVKKTSPKWSRKKVRPEGGTGGQSRKKNIMPQRKKCNFPAIREYKERKRLLMSKGAEHSTQKERERRGRRGMGWPTEKIKKKAI